MAKFGSREPEPETTNPEHFDGTMPIFDDLQDIYALHPKSITPEAYATSAINTRVSRVTPDRFQLLPDWLQRKYKTTVRNDLPPKTKDDLVNSDIFHEIDLKEDVRLPRRQPYITTPKLEQIINDTVQELLERNFIVPSKSPCSSPVVLTKKKDGSYRMYVDYRALNKITTPDPFPLPHINSLLGRIGSEIFSTLDLHSGYHQISMKPTDRYKTAFVTPSGKYEYTVMPFGLVNAPSTFARHMTDIIRDLQFVCVYLDDILVFSASQEQHWQHLDQVLGRLQDAGLIVKQKKCIFGAKQVQFLGFNVGIDKTTPLQDKCEAINTFPAPKTVKQAQRFMGLINYYRRFIRDCSRVSKSIHDFISGKAE